MSKVDVVMPQLGESLTEGTIVKWHKKPGDKIRKDETLLEISTDKVDSEIPSPVSGVVVRLLFEEQKTVPVRQVIAEIDTDENAAVAPAAPAVPAAAPAKPSAVPAGQAKGTAPAAAPAAAAPTPAAPASGRFYSPLVLSIAREEGVPMTELESIPGSGEGGRVNKKDILAYVERRKQSSAAKEQAAQRPVPTGSAIPHMEMTMRHAEAADLETKYPAPQYEILQMSNIIHKMAEHMLNTVRTSPHVWAVHEVDMSRIDKVRRRNAETFEQREGFKLTYTPFVCDAVIQALKEFPLVNASVEGDKIILKKFVNLGIAVASENGLIVPVIKNADEKNFVGLARAVNDLATRARSKRLTLADIEGGSFTITNYGVFGTKIGVPLINQPQVAILGTGAIQKRPVVINDAIAIRSMACFTLAFDHRIVDGALAGYFMSAVVRVLEQYDENLVL